MAESEGSGISGFLIGGLLVLALALGWFIWSRGEMPAADKPEITINVPDAPAAPAAPKP